MVIVGFTGARTGMSDLQKQKVKTILGVLDPKYVNHGDCVGADTDFHNMSIDYGFKVIIHPPEIDVARAYNKDYFEINPEYSYLKRNKHIVNESNVLIAAPSSTTEYTRSGTWHTIRYARSRKSAILFIVYPDGKIESEKFENELTVEVFY